MALSSSKLFHNGKANFKTQRAAKTAATKMVGHVSRMCSSCKVHLVHNLGDQLQLNSTRSLGIDVHLYPVQYNASAQPYESPHNFRHRALFRLLPHIPMASHDCALSIDSDVTILRDLGSLCATVHRTGQTIVGTDTCNLHRHGWIYWMRALVKQPGSRVPAEAQAALHKATFSLNAGILGTRAHEFRGLLSAVIAEMDTYDLAFSDMMAVWWLLHRDPSRLVAGWPLGPVNGPYYNALCEAKCLRGEVLDNFYLAHKYSPERVRRCHTNGTIAPVVRVHATAKQSFSLAAE